MFRIIDVKDICGDIHAEIAAIHDMSNNIILTVAYRCSSDWVFGIFIEGLERILNITKNKFKRIILCGDFNVKFGTSDEYVTALCDLVGLYNFVRAILDATRGPNYLDHIFVSDSFCNYKSCSGFASLITVCSILNCTAILLITPVYRVCRPITVADKHKIYVGESCVKRGCWVKRGCTVFD